MTLKERLELENLESLGLITGAKDEKGKLLSAPEVWKKKEVRTNTSLVYKQSKFQLFREEAEGYAKLITVLNNFGASPLCFGASLRANLGLFSAASPLPLI